MSDEPLLFTKSTSAEELLASAERVKSHALYVGTRRLIHESLQLREASKRVMAAADDLRKNAARKKRRS